MGHGRQVTHGAGDESSEGQEEPVTVYGLMVIFQPDAELSHG